jgi:mono/diheme cytochrome c family protein
MLGKEELMFARKTIQMVVLVVAFGVAPKAQEQPSTTIHQVPAKATSAASGKEMFNSYCAVCHGTDGKGNGPAASALKTPPADLTVLSKNNGGKYPALKVSSAIRGDVNVPAHGSKEMPIWGHVFFEMSGGHESEVVQRVANLDHYVESLQAK